jgi:hypothetical protein
MGLSQRSKLQQETLEKLQYAQMTHDMARDLYDMVKGFPARGRTVVYQVDYQALDASFRGRLMAQHPMPQSSSSSNSSKPLSYEPRTLTLQGMPTDLRTALVSSFAHFITSDGDDDRLVRIFCSLANTCHASDLIPTWSDYQLHRLAWCDYIQAVHQGISREQAKSLPWILLHGGTYETWKQAMDEQTAMTLPAASNDASWVSLQAFVFRLATEWRALRDVVLALPQFAWTELDRTALLSNHGTSPAAIPNVLMVRVLQACERDIWTIVERTFVEQGWKIRAKLMEGVLVEGPAAADPLPPVLAAAQHSCQLRGWNIALIEGPCYGVYTVRNLKEPLPLLQQARQAMEQLQQQQQQSTLQQQSNNRGGAAMNVQNNREGAVNATTNADNRTPADLDPTMANGNTPLLG